MYTLFVSRKIDAFFFITQSFYGPRINWKVDYYFSECKFLIVLKISSTLLWSVRSVLTFNNSRWNRIRHLPLYLSHNWQTRFMVIFGEKHSVQRKRKCIFNGLTLNGFKIKCMYSSYKANQNIFLFVPVRRQKDLSSFTQRSKRAYKYYKSPFFKRTRSIVTTIITHMYTS